MSPVEAGSPEHETGVAETDISGRLRVVREPAGRSRAISREIRRFETQRSGAPTPIPRSQACTHDACTQCECAGVIVNDVSPVAPDLVLWASTDWVIPILKCCFHDFAPVTGGWLYRPRGRPNRRSRGRGATTANQVDVHAGKIANPRPHTRDVRDSAQLMHLSSDDEGRADGADLLFCAHSRAAANQGAQPSSTQR